MPRSRRDWIAQALAALLGLGFIILGLRFASAAEPRLDGQGADFLLYHLRMFGVRDAFLGALALAFVALNERRALFLLFAGSLALPPLDSWVAAGLIGWDQAAGRNMPFELPLLLAAALLWPGGAAAFSITRGRASD